jgi:hypothetical protein
MPPIILELKGIGPIPSFKTGKRAFAWIDSKSATVMAYKGEIWYRKRGLKAMARPITLPEHMEWMKKAISLIESQLRSVFQTIGVEIRMAACPRSRIATLLPCDDCWTSFRELVVKSELCAPGQEGATITIERL